MAFKPLGKSPPVNLIWSPLVKVCPADVNILVAFVAVKSCMSWAISSMLYIRTTGSSITSFIVCIPSVVFNPKFITEPASTKRFCKGVVWEVVPKLEVVCVPPSNLYSKPLPDSVQWEKFISEKYPVISKN